MRNYGGLQIMAKFMKMYYGGVKVDASRLEGTASVMVQIQNRREWTGSDLVPRSFFRRTCKRAGVSSAHMLEVLKLLGWIGKEYVVFPLALTVPPFVFMSYEEWSSSGQRVIRGATSFARRTENGQALFSNYQVKRLI